MGWQTSISSTGARPARTTAPSAQGHPDRQRLGELHEASLAGGRATEKALEMVKTDRGKAAMDLSAAC